MEELDKAKQEALKQLDAMNLKAQKASFVKQVNDAKTVEEITKIVAEAKKVSDKNDKDDKEAEALAKAKGEALKQLDKMNLKDQKDAFVKKINDAKTVAAINKIVTEAQALSDKNDEEDAAVVEKEKFKERKLLILNNKTEDKFKRLAQRVILNNK